MSEGERFGQIINGGRCFMGAPLGEEYRCLNASVDGWWCTDCQAPPSCSCANCRRPFQPGEAV